jgi:aryl-alcohol dehydrogenase-like predicted oxidoreductase
MPIVAIERQPLGNQSPLHSRAIDPLGQIAARKSATPVQIALSRLLAQKPWIAPIPGTKLHRLKENIGAIDLGLTAKDLESIVAILSNIAVRDEHFFESFQALVSR